MIDYNTKLYDEPIKVTTEMVEDFIIKEEYTTMGNRSTICLLTLKNNIEIVGSATHQEAIIGDEAIGKATARQHAFDHAYLAVISHYLKG